MCFGSFSHTKLLKADLILARSLSVVRLLQDGMQNAWDPVYIADVLSNYTIAHGIDTVRRRASALH